MQNPFAHGCGLFPDQDIAQGEKHHAGEKYVVQRICIIMDPIVIVSDRHGQTAQDRPDEKQDQQHLCGLETDGRILFTHVHDGARDQKIQRDIKQFEHQRGKGKEPGKHPCRGTHHYRNDPQDDQVFFGQNTVDHGHFSFSCLRHSRQLPEADTGVIS